MSRQLVGAIEAGRHRPGVDAALALASVLEQSVEELFAPPASLGPSVAVLGDTSAERSGDGLALRRKTEPVLAARLGDQVVHAPAGTSAAAESWTAANAVLRDGETHPLPGADLDGLVVVGCDPALGLAAALLPAAGPRRIVAVAGSTARGIAALAAGRAHAALVHGPSESLPDPTRPVLRLHLARWQVGLTSHRSAARSLAAFEGPRVRIVQREPGASSQQAFERALKRDGGQPPGGPIATGHLDVARRVAAGADGGVTMEPAAVSHGLSFLALEEHEVQIWIDERWAEHPGARALGDLLGSPALRTRLDLVGGYDLTECGLRRGGSG